MGASYLIDTHVVVWLLDRGALGSQATRDALGDPANAILVSAVSAYELSLKHWLGKMPEAGPLLSRWAELLRSASISALAVSPAHGLAAGSLEWDHRDPLDRLLVGQAVVEGLTLVTADRAMLGAPGVDVLPW